jgi:general nucleoside transport system permease protein
MDASTTADFFSAAVRSATPLLLAAIGEAVTERAGVINVGLEGSIIVGCLAGVAAAAVFGPVGGLVAAGVAGCAIAGIFAVMAIGLGADQIITGTAITMLGLGLTSMLYRVLYGDSGAALSVPTLPPVAIPMLERVPLLGAAFFRQPLPTYIAFALAPITWWWLYRTHAGLALRATGENPEAARASGIRPHLLQTAGVLFGGACGGLAGGTLVLAQVGTFAEGMSAGRGFIAIAIVALGRWNPIGVALASLIFGMASALQFVFQSLGLDVPYQVFLALPYLLTLVALALASGRYTAPAALGSRPSAVE